MKPIFTESKQLEVEVFSKVDFRVYFELPQELKLFPIEQLRVSVYLLPSLYKYPERITIRNNIIEYDLSIIITDLRPSYFCTINYFFV